MKNVRVEELMLPLTDYAVVPANATLLEALQALDAAQKRLPPERPHHRAVLVRDSRGKIVGKLGQHGFLRALEPKYAALDNVDELSHTRLDEDFVNSIMDSYRFWQDSLADVCRRAHTIRISQVMKPIEASIDANQSLNEAIHLLVTWQTASLLVTRAGDVIGILRLSDLFRRVADTIISAECADS
jgi:CBS domain containing-hemolysin-like protein